MPPLTVDHLQMGLAVVSALQIPYVSPSAALANTGIDLYRGNYTSAALSVMPMGRVAGAATRQVTKAAPLLRGTKALQSSANVARKTKIPNPYGSKGSPAHVGKIEEIKESLLAKGYRHVAGGKELKEIAIEIPKEGFKPLRRPDLIMRSPATGKEIHVNVGRVTKKGDPIARERRALEDLNRVNQPKGYETIFEPYFPEK